MKTQWIALLAVIFGLALCQPAAAVVMLNEFLYDTPGTDDVTIMFVELWGTPGTSLAGWSLVGINGNGGGEYLNIPLSGTIPADSIFVVGGTATANVDLVVTADFQNAGAGSSPDCDGIQLRNGAVTVDRVCYGVCSAGHVCTGEGNTNAPDVDNTTGGPTRSIGRTNHVDTDNNATDWSIFDPVSPGLPNSGVPCDSQTVTLADIRENDANGVSLLLGDFVITRGIVNIDNFLLDSLTLSRFYIQDATAGVHIFRGAVPAGIIAGDCVRVAGWVSQYNGLAEIVSSGSGTCVYNATRLDHVAPPVPTLITTLSDLEAQEGRLVRLNNVTIVSGTWPATGEFGNLVVTDGNGTIGLNISKWTNIDGSLQPTGAFDLVGILGQYDNTSPYTVGYQIIPRSTADISPPTVPCFAANPPHLDFGYALIGATSPTQGIFYLANRCDAALTVNSITVNPPFTTNFTVPVTIQPHDSHGVWLTFTPLSTTLFRDTLRIVSTSPDSPHLMPVSGTGAAPGITAHPDFLDFGVVALESENPLNFAVLDTGHWDLKIVNMQFGVASPFTLVPEPSFPDTVSAQDSLTYTIRFAPTAHGFVRDTLTIIHNATVGPVRIPLSGTGAQPVMALAPDTLFFLTASGFPVIDTFRVFNTGDMPLTVTHLVPPTGPVFSLATAGFIVEPGDSHAVAVTFNGNSGGHIDAAAYIYSDGGIDSVVLIGDIGGAVDDPALELPTDFFLDQNFPNPFNPSTQIRFGVPYTAEVSLAVFDVLGRNVATLSAGKVEPGIHTITWDCSTCPSGMYLVRMQTQNRVLFQKMLLMK